MSYLHYLSEVYVSFIFEGPVIFFTALGVGWRIFERTHGSTGTGGGGGNKNFSPKEYKVDYRKLTADGEGGRGRMMRILESLIGEIR